jgi:hypothetical protein
MIFRKTGWLVAFSILWLGSVEICFACCTIKKEITSAMGFYLAFSLF